MRVKALEAWGALQEQRAQKAEAALAESSAALAAMTERAAAMTERVAALQAELLVAWQQADAPVAQLRGVEPHQGAGEDDGLGGEDQAQVRRDRAAVLVAGCREVEVQEGATSCLRFPGGKGMVVTLAARQAASHHLVSCRMGGEQPLSVGARDLTLPLALIVSW